jgi:hypothetical protein
MSRPPTLAETQRLFWTLVSAPEGVDATIARPDAEAARLRAALDAQIEGDDRLSAIERLDIYANMYFYRLRDCLAEDFPVLQAVVGEVRFHNLITDYLLAHPSRHPSLRYAGRALPTWLAGQPLTEEWPFLVDLARLEWAILDAFDAANSRPLTEGDLERVPPADWPALRLRMTPSVQLLDLGWAVHDTWRRVDRDEPPGTPTHAPTPIIVWRREFRVFHRPTDALERDALDVIRAGEAFGVLCERVGAAVGEAAAATTALGLIRQWLADGLLAADD